MTRRKLHSIIGHRGFTIVELLIVVVVIAILAAITIVAYNGINNRAKSSAVASAAQQAAKKVMAHAVTNAEEFPANLSDAGVNNAGSTTYQYRVDNSTTPKTFCLTATSQSVSYYASNTVTAPVAGACAGHGANGVVPITNLVTNPSLEANLNNCIISTGGGTATLQRTTTTPLVGAYAARGLWTVAAPNEVAISCMAAVEAGKTYSARVAARPSWTGAQMRIQLAWTGSSSSWSGGASTAASAGQWNSRTATFTAPTGATSVYVQASFISGSKPAANDTLDADGFMLVEGSTVPTYADGDSTGWAWNGTAHNSTSSGPAL